MQFIKTYIKDCIRDDRGHQKYISPESQINKDLEEHKNWSIYAFQTAFSETITVVFNINEESKILNE